MRTETSTPTYTKIKTLTSHAAYFRFLEDVEDTEETIALPSSIPSPYRHSETEPIYKYNGKKVFAVETSHKRYEIFEV